MKISTTVLAIFIVVASVSAYGKGQNTNSALAGNGDKVATAAEKAMGIDNPRTGEQRVRDAAERVGREHGEATARALGIDKADTKTDTKTDTKKDD